MLLINGVPVATLELKTQFTQTVHDAIKQYRFDRPPKDPTTRLGVADTVFLPFSQAHNETAGQNDSPDFARTIGGEPPKAAVPDGLGNDDHDANND